MGSVNNYKKNGEFVLGINHMIFKTVFIGRKEGNRSGNLYNEQRHLFHPKTKVIRNVEKNTSTI